MFEDWIKEKQTCTDKDIEKDFGIPTATLKKWRLNIDHSSPMFFKLGATILYPRKAFVDWFMKHTKNKKADVVPIGSKSSKANISEK
jgi:hypothetical protein|tara:strand:+ start:184 stop:444 length:261 start_codon:yes stop_codon:yes gene_type:complete